MICQTRSVSGFAARLIVEIRLRRLPCCADVVEAEARHLRPSGRGVKSSPVTNDKTDEEAVPRWDGVRGNSAVTVLACNLSEITDEHIAPMAQQLVDGVILLIATRRQAADGTPLWLRVWCPGRWIYLAALAAPSAEEAAAYARSGPAEMAKRPLIAGR